MTVWTVAGKASLLSLFFAYLSKVSQVGAKRFVSGLKILLRLGLTLGAFTAFVVAAWTLSMALGLLVLGICLLVFEWMVKQ